MLGEARVFYFSLVTHFVFFIKDFYIQPIKNKYSTIENEAYTFADEYQFSAIECSQ